MTFSSRLYRKTLLLYPADLRREFGEDMTATFAEDLSNSVGIARKLRVWWCCLMDVLRIAIPAQKENPLVMVPLVAFFSVTTWDAVALGGAFWHGEPPFGHMPVSGNHRLLVDTLSHRRFRRLRGREVRQTHLHFAPAPVVQCSKSAI